MCTSRPQVRISGGVIAGTVTTAVTGEHAHAYLNIPYAAPPLGALRFAAPQPASAWAGVRDGSRYGLEPVQQDEERLPFQLPRSGQLDPATGLPDYMGEDCLALNVFTPTSPAGLMGPLPVMFYIFGGGFNNGANSLPMYDGTRLCNCKQPVVVVTVNYR